MNEVIRSQPAPRRKVRPDRLRPTITTTSDKLSHYEMPDVKVDLSAVDVPDTATTLFVPIIPGALLVLGFVYRFPAFFGSLADLSWLDAT